MLITPVSTGRTWLPWGACWVVLLVEGVDSVCDGPALMFWCSLVVANAMLGVMVDAGDDGAAALVEAKAAVGGTIATGVWVSVVLTVGRVDMIESECWILVNIVAGAIGAWSCWSEVGVSEEPSMCVMDAAMKVAGSGAVKGSVVSEGCRAGDRGWAASAGEMKGEIA
jgi:hypothetical protein